MIPALFAAALGTAAMPAPVLARITRVFAPCSVQRAHPPRTEPLSTHEGDAWNLHLDDRVRCTGRGSARIRSDFGTIDTSNYVAVGSPLGTIRGRNGNLLPLLLGGGAARRLPLFGPYTPAQPLANRFRFEAKGTTALDHVSMIRPEDISAASRAATQSESFPLENVRGTIGRIPIAEDAFAQGQTVRNGSSIVRNLSKGEAGVAIVVIGAVIWLFVAKQWLWLAVVGFVGTLVILANRRS